METIDMDYLTNTTPGPWQIKPDPWGRFRITSDAGQKVSPTSPGALDMSSPEVWDGVIAISPRNGARSEATAEFLVLLRNLNGSIDTVKDYERLEGLLGEAYPAPWQVVVDEWGEHATVHSAARRSEPTADPDAKGRFMVLHRFDGKTVHGDLAFVQTAHEHARALLEASFDKLHRRIPLMGGETALVDADDGDLAAGIEWHQDPDTGEVVNDAGTALADLISPIRAVNHRRIYRRGPLVLKRSCIPIQFVGRPLALLLSPEWRERLEAQARNRGLEVEELVCNWSAADAA